MNKCQASRTAWSRNRVLLGALLALGATGLSGCGNMNSALEKENAIDYKSTKQQSSAPLSIPPDLTQAANEPSYRSSVTGATTYSEYEQSQKHAGGVTPVVHGSTVLPQRADMHIAHEGKLWWLVVMLPPEQVFSKAVDFWTSQGFTIQANDPAAGLIETDWAENRAKIPDSWFRRTLGMILDRVYDSGEREKFRTRFERVKDRTEIFISHQHLIEKNSKAPDSVNLRWEVGPEDPELNAAMLARLKVYLGNRLDSAGQAAGAQPGAAASGATLAATASSTRASSPPTSHASAASSLQQPTPHVVRLEGATLTLTESFDDAWRRVGIALASGGFTVIDRDRSAGDYFVRYVDTDTGVKQEEPNFFSRLLGRDKSKQANQYRLHVASHGDSSQVTVYRAHPDDSSSATAPRAKDTMETSPTAQRLLSVLADKMQTE